MKIAEPYFDSDEIALLRECIESRHVTQGPMVARFEAAIAAAVRAPHVISCSSGSAALHLSMLALDLGPGDEVIVPAFTWVTSAHAAEYVGAKAVFADIDLSTFNIDPISLEAAVTPRTRAVVAVHLFGLAAPMDEIREICVPRGIQIVEDAACAIATTYRGEPVGVLGDLGCFSFHPRKLVTTGEGGAVTTNEPTIADRIRSLCNQGATGLPPLDKERHGPWTMLTFDRLGYNLRLSDIQAAVGVAQMGKLNKLVANRRATARRYNDLLRNATDIILPLAGDVQGHTYQSYVVRIAEGGRARRNAIMSALAAAEIQTRPGTHAVHRLGYYRNKYKIKSEDFPKAAVAEDTTITLPILLNMSDRDVTRVANELIKSVNIFT